MSTEDPNRTTPRADAFETPVADTKPQADAPAADPDRTPPLEAPPDKTGRETLVGRPDDVARQEVTVLLRAAEGVPGYVILGELGKGGMGIVHKARHVKLNRIVALKMVLAGAEVSRGDLIRFLAEAESVAAIKHENVVQVFDFGEANGRPFMALEFLSGGTLQARFEKGRAGTNSSSFALDTARLLGQIARGVAAAHAQGIVHRDLKPGNVLLDESGVPKVADFGLAKRGDGSDVTQTGQGMGTPAYMSPEQARDAKFVGPQADVWALGVILYEALTGNRPFTGTVQEILARAQSAEPVAPRQLVPTVPRDLELICLKCLAKEPHERYPTAKELADDLDRYLRGEPISVRPAGPFERGYKWVKRNKVVSASAAAVFVALVGTAVAFALARQANKKTDETLTKQKQTDDALQASVQSEKDATAAREQAEARLREAVTATASFLAVADDLEESLGKNTALLTRLQAQADENLDRLRKVGLSAEVREQQAALQALKARLYLNQGRTDLALPAIEEAIALYEDILRTGGSDETRAGRVGAYLTRAHIFNARGASVEAARDAGRALELASELAAAHPGEDRWAHLRAKCSTQVGFTYWVRGYFPEGDRHHADALKQRLAMADTIAPVGNPVYRRHLAKAHYNHGWMLDRLNDPKAVDGYRKAHDLLTAIAPGSVAAQYDLVEVSIDLATPIQRDGDHKRAVELLTTAERLCAGLLQADPNNGETLRLEMRVLLARKQLLPPGADPKQPIREQLAAVEKLLPVCDRFRTADPANAVWANRSYTTRRLIALNLLALNPEPSDDVTRRVTDLLATARDGTRRLMEADPEDINALMSYKSALQSLWLFDRWRGHKPTVESIRASSQPSVDFYRRRAAKEPDRAEWWIEIGKLRLEAAGSYLQIQRYDEIEAECLAALEELRTVTHPTVVRLRGQLALQLAEALLFRTEARPDKALSAKAADAFRVAIAAFESLLVAAPEDREVRTLWLDANSKLATALDGADRRAEAEAVRLKARAVRLQLVEGRVTRRGYVPQEPKFVSEAAINSANVADRRSAVAKSIQLAERTFALRATSDKALDLADFHLDAARLCDPKAPDLNEQLASHLTAIVDVYDKLTNETRKPLSPEEERLVKVVREAIQELKKK